jgi:hypothetical protein
MSIFLQSGVEVEIIGQRDDVLIVRAIDEPAWVRERDIADLRADGGPHEIDAAIQALEGK